MVLGLLIGIVISLLISALIIWIVGKLGLGLSVSGFGSALLAAAVIAIVSGLVAWLLGLLGITIGGGVLGAIVHLIIAAIVLMISDRFLAGLRVDGFVGALVAAIAMGVVGWLAAWLVSLLGLG